MRVELLMSASPDGSRRTFIEYRSVEAVPLVVTRTA